MFAVRRVVALLVALASLGTAGRTARADRIIAAQIRLLDRHVVLRASDSDDGSPDADAVWQSLKEIRFRSGRDVVIRPDADPLRATLRGEIEVAIEYGGSIEVPRLTLVRDNKGTGEWGVAPRQVDRMQKRRSRSYHVSDEKRRKREAARRKNLWDGLRRSLPDDAGPIRAYAENDALTVVCFRRERATWWFRTETGKVERAIHAKVLPRPVNRITYFVSDRGVGRFRLWHDGEVELTISSPE